MSDVFCGALDNCWVDDKADGCSCSLPRFIGVRFRRAGFLINNLEPNQEEMGLKYMNSITRAVVQRKA